jgi:hypothetical protein
VHRATPVPSLAPQVTAVPALAPDSTTRGVTPVMVSPLHWLVPESETLPPPELVPLRKSVSTLLVTVTSTTASSPATALEVSGPASTQATLRVVT